MSDQDPIDTMLRRAFEADRASTETPDITTRVVARIRRRLRVRSLVIGTAVLAGTAALSLSTGPALETWLERVAVLLPERWVSDHLGLMLLAAVGAASLLALDAELG